MPSPIPFDDVLEAKKPAGLTLEMINDTAHADAVNRAIGRRDTAQRLFDRDKSASNTNDLIEAEQALDAVRAAAREATRYWRFVAIGRVAYEALRDAHPSSKVERDDYRKKMAAMGRQQSEIGQIVWSAATFPPDRCVLRRCVRHRSRRGGCDDRRGPVSVARAGDGAVELGSVQLE
jgi:hypothetical protein